MPLSLHMHGFFHDADQFCLQAVLVDMEEGVVSEMMKGPLRDVFDFRQLITDVSGSGNNW